MRSESDEVLLLTVFGFTLLVAGLAQQAQESAGVGAFLVGLALSGPVATRATQLTGPLRDLFAATFFFFFFGLQIDAGDLPAVMPIAAVLAVLTAGTKIATGWRAARRGGVSRRGRVRAGLALRADPGDRRAAADALVAHPAATIPFDGRRHRCNRGAPASTAALSPTGPAVMNMALFGEFKPQHRAWRTFGPMPEMNCE